MAICAKVRRESKVTSLTISWLNSTHLPTVSQTTMWVSFQWTFSHWNNNFLPPNTLIHRSLPAITQTMWPCGLSMDCGELIFCDLYIHHYEHMHCIDYCSKWNYIHWFSGRPTQGATQKPICCDVGAEFDIDSIQVTALTWLCQTPGGQVRRIRMMMMLSIFYFRIYFQDLWRNGQTWSVTITKTSTTYGKSLSMCAKVWSIQLFQSASSQSSH